MLCLRFGTQRRQPRRRQVCARRDALSSWHEVRRPLPHRPGPSTRARDRRRSSEALVSILHAGGERAWRGLLPSARTAGCVVAFVIAELRAPSRSRTRCRCHAPRLPVPLARAASSASRVPSAWRPSRPRAAPPPPCTLAHASASASADRLSWATPLRRRLVSRRHVARASPARSADFDLRALDPPMAASDGPRGQRPPERVRRCAESELNQQIIPSRPASLSRPKRAAAATLQAIDRSLDEQDRAIPSQYSAGTTQRTALNG